MCDSIYVKVIWVFIAALNRSELSSKQNISSDLWQLPHSHLHSHKKWLLCVCGSPIAPPSCEIGQFNFPVLLITRIVCTIRRSKHTASLLITVFFLCHKCLICVHMYICILNSVTSHAATCQQYQPCDNNPKQRFYMSHCPLFTSMHKYAGGYLIK